MASLPSPSPAVSGPPIVERMSRADCCPDCCRNVETPYRFEDTPDGFVAFYGCESCGWFWSTGWRD